MKKTIVLAALFWLATAFALYRPSLEYDGRYFLPPQNRLLPQQFGTADSLALLAYNASFIKRWAVVDFELGVVFLHETINGVEVYAPRAVPIDTFIKMMNWWRWQIEIRKLSSAIVDGGTKIEIPIGDLPPGVQTIIGTGGAGLNVDGSYKITLSGRSEWSDRDIFGGSAWPQLQMEQESNFRITGTIGSKITVSVDQDSKRETDLENTINIRYKGEEDDVVQSIEAGNTTLNLPGASLVGYSERIQGLFGLKTIFQVGDWNITTIASQEKANTQTISINAQTQSDKFRRPDYQYKERTYYWIDMYYMQRNFNPAFVVGDSIFDFDIYIVPQSGTSNPAAVRGFAFANMALYSPGTGIPDTMPDTRPSYDSLQIGIFERMEPEKYLLDNRSGWFRLKNSASSGDILGVKYKVKHPDGSIDTVGFFGEGNTVVFLKLIKPQNLLPSNVCWELEWRNVYSLNKSDVSLDETFVSIWRKAGTDSSQFHPSYENVLYLSSLFAMDSFNVNGDPPADGNIDQSVRYFDATRGELIFPVPHPFDPRAIDSFFVRSLANYPDSLRNSAIYNTTDASEMDRNSKCFLRIEAKGFSVVQDLGTLNIIEGSEIVKLNGERLRRDVDYTISYQIGQIRFISDKARDPNAKIEITFEAQPFMSMQQKTLLGSRLQYDLGENSWIGLTGLYKSTTTPERRPRVGGEPARAYMWDADLKFAYELPFLTAAVDALPLLQTDQLSTFSLTLETAQLLSNPNTLGKAYIDDFEGSKASDPLSITRTMWTVASAGQEQVQQNRCSVIWYNPYDRININQIWPRRRQAANQSTTDIITIEVTDTALAGTNAWATLVQPINLAYQDQSKAQYLDIWIQGSEGILTVDVGRVSEDINGNGVLNTEDSLIAGRYDNTLMGSEEDKGYDGMFDNKERIYYLVNEGGYIEEVVNAMSDAEKRVAWQAVYPSTPMYPEGFRSYDDPSGDNWAYPSERDYRRINGTEGNINDPVGIRKPDTEDIDRNNILDRDEGYYHFEIDLTTTNYMVPGSDESEYGWRLYRLPVKDSLFQLVEDGRVWTREEIGDANLATVKHVRLGLKNIPDGSAKISIAKIEFVKNQWEESFENFEVATKNSQEDDFEEREQAEIDRETGLPLAQNVLALKYENLSPLDTVFCIKTLTDERAENYTQYKKMLLWVYFDSTKSNGPAPVAFLRVGDKSNSNYYEFQTAPLVHGWSDSNRIEFVFDSLTSFKDCILRDTIFNEMPAPSGIGKYRVVGNPTLTNITKFVIGIINANPDSVNNGEVLVDELMVEDVRSEDGRAYKAETNIQAADFLGFVATLEQRDDDFHTLTQTQSAYSRYSSIISTEKKKTQTQNYTTNWTLGKFFPIRWGVNLPLSLNWSKRVDLPRFKTGSDIFLNDSLRELEKTIERGRQVSLMGVGISPQNPSWPLAIFVVPNKFSYSWRKVDITSPTYLYDNRLNYSFKHVYNLSPKPESALWVIRPAGTDSLGKKIGEDFAISYVPSKIDIGTEIVGQKIDQARVADYSTGSFTRELRHTTNLDYKPVKSVLTSLTIGVDRDIHKDGWLDLTPPFIIGKPIKKTINDKLQWKPATFDFLTQQYDLENKYTENTRNAVAGTFGLVDQVRTFKADYTLKWQDLFGKPDGKKTDAAEAFDFKKIASRLDNLRLNYNWRETNTLPALAERPGRIFQFGFTSDPGVESGESAGVTRSPSKNTTNSLDISTGVKLPYEIDLKTKYNWTLNRTVSLSQNSKTVSTTFPDLNAKWGFFSKWKLVQAFSTSSSANSAWAYKTTKNFSHDSLSQRTSEHKFNPLLGMNFTMKGGWNLDIKLTWETSTSETYTGRVSYIGNDRKSLDVTARYSIRGNKGLKIPLLGNVTFENNLNLSLMVSYGTRLTQNWSDEYPDPVRTLDNAKLTIKPQANYKVSNNATAGIEIEITEDKNRLYNDTNHIRDVRIWVQFMFGGGKSVGGRSFTGDSFDRGTTNPRIPTR